MKSVTTERLAYIERRFLSVVVNKGINRESGFVPTEETGTLFTLSSVTTNIPEWDGQELRLGFEDEGVFTKGGARLVDGYQNRLLLIG